MAVEEWGNEMRATAASAELLSEETIDDAAHVAGGPLRIDRSRRLRA